MRPKASFYFLCAWVSLAIALGLGVSGLNDFVRSFIAKSSSTIGGEVNAIIAWLVVFVAPFLPFILVVLKPVSLISLTVALLPLLQRLQPILGIYGYTDINTETVSISGISLVVPVLFLYLLFRYPERGGWKLLSSKFFWILTISGTITQFFFFSPIAAARIAYLVIIGQLLWYLIIVRYVNTIEDALMIAWGMIISGVLYTFLATFTTGAEGDLMFQTEGYGRLRGIGGLGTHYGLLMASLLSLLPAVYYKSGSLAKILLLAIVPVFLRGLLLTGARGAYLSLLPIVGYLFIFTKQRRYVLYGTIGFLIFFFLFEDQISLYLYERRFYVEDKSVQIRISVILFTLSQLFSWPHFLIGFGLGTFDNWVPIPDNPMHSIQGVHHGFLSIWVTTGFMGLLGFSLCVGYGIWVAVRKASNYRDFKQRVVLLGFVVSIVCWVFFFMVAEGWYTVAFPEIYTVLTTEIGIVVSLAQKRMCSQNK